MREGEEEEEEEVREGGGGHDGKRVSKGKTV